MTRHARNDGKVVRCKKTTACLLVQVSRKEDNGDVDEGVRFVLTPPEGERIVMSGAPRQHIFEDLAPGKWVVTVEFESERPGYFLDGQPSTTFDLKKGDFEFALFNTKRHPWIEVELVDEETSAPIEGAKVRIRTVDDQVLDATTNAQGVARFAPLDASDHVIETVIAADPTTPRPDGQKLAPLRMPGGEVLAPAAGNTLGALAKTHEKQVGDWRGLALHNFGTDEVRALRRAMFEIVGCRIQDLAGDDPAHWRFDGNEATRGGTGELLVPSPWPVEPLGLMKRTTLKLSRTRPLPAISFEALDKWFVPGDPAEKGETCTVKYAVEGLSDFADQVAFDVFGSHYAKATVAQDGQATWTEVDVPLHSATLPEAQSHAAGGKTHEVKDWTGESTATDGALKPRAGKKRYLNVAFSPYTVQLQHFKDDEAKKSRLKLESFWPLFDRKANPVAPLLDSLKIEWEVVGAKELSHGSIVVVDRSDKRVFHKALAASELTEGSHAFEWDGVLDDGTQVVPEQMPYRVQLQARTGAKAKKALALCAMHTEVRAFVHPLGGRHEEHEALQDPSSLQLGFAPWAPAPPEKTKDEDKWAQYTLAQAGFHPGPIDGRLVTNEAKRALREFQRSVPKGIVAPFSRLAVSEAADADTLSALEHLPQALHRPLLAGADSFDAIALDSDVAQSRLKDPAKEFVVWVDDRHVYTDPGGVALPSPEMGMGNYRGAMDVGDARTDNDATEIARPWLPLQARFALLGKTQTLDATSGVAGKHTWPLVGPLRVDWDFDEPVENTAAVIGGYDTTAVRTHAWVKQAKHASEEVLPDSRVRQNAPDTLGGIRPADGTKYFKNAFGVGDRNLAPWNAFADDTLQRVCTHVHDDLGQAEDAVFEEQRGASGVFFVPSNIAGDGYRVHARLGVAKADAEASPFPNRAALEKRYPVPPRASTAAFTVWRRTSYRGYLRWAPATQDKWAANKEPAGRLYAGARLKFFDEPSSVGASLHHDDVSTFMDQAKFDALVRTYVTAAPYRTYNPTLAREFVWPYDNEEGFGIAPYISTWDAANPNKILNDFYQAKIEPLLNATWRRYRYALLYEVLAGVEATEGRLRGHFMVDFKDGPGLEVVEYHCDTCDVAKVDITNNRPKEAGSIGKTITSFFSVFGVYSPEKLAASKGVDGRDVPIRFQDDACSAPGCTGKLKLRRCYLHPLCFPAVGGGLGAAFLFDSGPDVWAHEMGHHRHLEHAQANPSATDPLKLAPGAKNQQHDSQPNPSIAGKPVRDSGWDCMCIMSYNHGPGLTFCGKCIMKMRGWKVEGLPNPAGGVHD